jgi:hypothetical protein
MKRGLFLLSTILLTPLVSFAVGPSYVPPTTPQTANDVFYSFAWGNMKGFIPALIGVAFITFLTGIVKYVTAGDNEESRQSGRNMMIYGIIVLFVMIAFWGLVSIVYKSFFTTEVGIPNYLPFTK